MHAFTITDLVVQQQKEQTPYYEFIRNASMSMGIYRLNAGDVDRQHPHSEDEAYYIVQGQGVINVASEDRGVGPGDIVYVAAGVEHFFHLITEDLIILVFFAPAEGTQSLRS